MKIQNRTASVTMEVEPGLLAARRALTNTSGLGFCYTGVTGTMAVSLAAISSIWTLRIGASGIRAAVVDRVRVRYTTLVAAAALTTERLELARFNNTVPSGGTTGRPFIKNPRVQSSYAMETQTSTPAGSSGGDVRIATTAALTVTSIRFEGAALRSVPLTHVSNVAGGFVDCIWEFSDWETQPVILNSGDGLAIRNPVAFPATQTWQLQVDADWREFPAHELDDMAYRN